MIVDHAHPAVALIDEAALGALAIHFDALAGQPTRLDLFAGAVGETLEALPNTVATTLRGTWPALTWLGIAGAGLALAWAVTR